MYLQDTKSFRYVYYTFLMLCIAFTLWCFAINVLPPKYSYDVHSNFQRIEQNITLGFFHFTLTNPTIINVPGGEGTVSLSEITNEAIASISLMSFFWLVLFLTNIAGSARFKKYTPVHLMWIVLFLMASVIATILLVAFLVPPSLQAFVDLSNAPYVRKDDVYLWYTLEIYRSDAARRVLYFEINDAVIGYGIAVLGFLAISFIVAVIELQVFVYSLKGDTDTITVRSKKKVVNYLS
ncbi:hypothetical protein [Ureaplasma canigenitalium]|uniref:hypothetical protein n=1 Tax=Ureaplasma canigenitalium TaxID=42092 RepID=UPI0004E0F512|nr:hypothetical protein [Ureaplasma canigenitalium]